MTSKPKKMTKKYTTEEQYAMKADLWAKRMFPDMDYKEYDWVITKHEQIAKHILEQYEPATTRAAHFNALAMLINRYEPDTELVDKYKKVVQQFRKKIDRKNEEQNSDYVPQKTILKMGNEIFQQAIRKPNDKKLNMVGLSILLNVLHPPMRNQLYDLPIVQYGSDVPYEETPNYTYRDVDGRWHIVIRMEQKQKINMNDDMISPEMSKIIDHSIKMYPRKYLISSWIKDINLSEGTIRNNLGEMNPSLGVDVFRHSYIIDFYNTKKSYKDRKNLARMMLHSINTADMIYDTYMGKAIESNEQKQTAVKKHPPPPPRPTGVEPFTGLSKNQIAPPRPPKPLPVVEQKEEKVDEPVVVQVVRVPKKPKQTPEERKLKNRELKKIYREKNKELLAQKERERYKKLKENKEKQ